MSVAEQGIPEAGSSELSDREWQLLSRIPPSELCVRVRNPAKGRRFLKLQFTADEIDLIDQARHGVDIIRAQGLQDNERSLVYWELYGSRFPSGMALRNRKKVIGELKIISEGTRNFFARARGANAHIFKGIMDLPKGLLAVNVSRIRSR